MVALVGALMGIKYIAGDISNIFSSWYPGQGHSDRHRDGQWSIQNEHRVVLHPSRPFPFSYEGQISLKNMMNMLDHSILTILQFVHDSDTPIQIFEPFVLLGLLANYNKFEFQNPYQLRLDDFVNESSIQKIVKGVGTSCGALRNGYVAVQDDAPEGWSLFSTLIYFGLGALTPGSNERTNPPTSEEAKELFASL